MPASPENTVLILAPLGQDAPIMAAMLEGQGIRTRICSDPADCVTHLAIGAGALLLTEESLELPHAPDLLDRLKAQPAWSELPLILLTHGGEQRVSSLLELAASAAGSVTLLERPMGASTLLRSVQVALRSRHRQYQVRDLLLEQQCQQAQLRASEQRLRLAKSAAQLGIHDFYPLTGELIWDERVRELWGVDSQGPVSYELFMSRLHPDDRAPTQAAVDRALDPAGPGDYYAEYRLVHGPRTIWIAATGHVTFENGRAVRLVGTVKDITQRKEFQAELERQVAERTAKLADMVSELQHVSYAMVHDMRAPLRAMIGFVESLREELSHHLAREEALEHCRLIRSGATRLDKLITDALNYTQAALGEIPMTPVSLPHLVQDLLDTYPNFRPDNADIRVEGELPVVFGNESLLTQCFSNLLGNAVKFVAPGVKPRVRIRAERVDGQETQEQRLEEGTSSGMEHGTRPKQYRPTPPVPLVRIWVEDNGIGIPKPVQKRLFGMFQKLDSQYEGTGIGLAIVRKVVERMGGRVGAESEPGHGSRFWVELPPVR